MEKAKMMLNSVLHEKNQVDRSVLIRYYISEYKSSNPIFLSQFFKVMFDYIYKEEDLGLLDMLIDNFYDEVCVYGYSSTKEINSLLSYFVSSGKVSYIIRLSPIASELGDSKTLKIMNKILMEIRRSRYIDPKDIFTIKKAIHDLQTRISLGRRVKVDIIDQGIFSKWKRFECLE